ncbi:flagellar motor switching and energizing phosphatase [Carnobacterium sp. 17-4]|uniref:flagellar motor switch phosphatase FliY n=1 Tax=Carnobacterium sp. (strain 17-4) TaxID=208596 RepID=UPI0002058B1F|nr:flagellar motor switch phosphatase FliY [Carnobacterium sp. 17-4]AEB30668.1 flagellar motor switching and energizing phosphatase [Carnobacterium sp. 17-4]
MSSGKLTQEEIDAMMNGNASAPEPTTNDTLDQTQTDIIGEIGNISMSQAATTLSSILSRRVTITTPVVSCLKFQEIIDASVTPKVVTTIEFKKGLAGSNLLMMNEKDAIIIADLMMDGDGNAEGKEFTELELSAVGEAMNQMMGSAATAMATMLERIVDILPPEVEVWKNQEQVNYDRISGDTTVCKIAFQMTVDDLIESEIMQIFTLETVRNISNIVLADEGEVITDRELPKAEEMTAPIEAVSQATSNADGKIGIQKPEFQELTHAGSLKTPRNLDLIMDVPLQFSVMLGESKKTIKDILSLGTGSVVELNKMTDEPLEIYVNGKLIAEGEVVVINESFGIRITNILSKEQRIKHLN